VVAGRLKAGGDGSLGCPGPEQPAVGPFAEHQAQRVEDDRLAGAGLAGEHGKTRGELQIEALDQDDVADGQAQEHG
jgi:hypothetical protein